VLHRNIALDPGKLLGRQRHGPSGEQAQGLGEIHGIVVSVTT
jgi:hypothetical protein